MKKLEKRLYTFPHFMLSPMAKGIQTLHSTVELFNLYVPNPSNNFEVKVPENEVPFEILFDWSLNHKTVISLNPGVSGDMEELIYIFQDQDNFYPWAIFQEDDYSLKGIVTAISIVLTEKIYYSASIIRGKDVLFDEISGRFSVNNSSLTLDEMEIISNYGRFSDFEVELIYTLNKYRLAN